MTTEDNKKFVTGRIPDAYARKYAKLSICIWSPLLNQRISAFFHTEDEAWADSVELLKKR